MTAQTEQQQQQPEEPIRWSQLGVLYARKLWTTPSSEETEETQRKWYRDRGLDENVVPHWAPWGLDRRIPPGTEARLIHVNQLIGPEDWERYSQIPDRYGKPVNKRSVLLRQIQQAALTLGRKNGGLHLYLQCGLAWEPDEEWPPVTADEAQYFAPTANWPTEGFYIQPMEPPGDAFPYPELMQRRVGVAAGSLMRRRAELVADPQVTPAALGRLDREAWGRVQQAALKSGLLTEAEIAQVMRPMIEPPAER
jgi:hypothetical protein